MPYGESYDSGIFVRRKLRTAQARGAVKNGEASHIIDPTPTPTPTLPDHTLPYPSGRVG